MQCGGGALLLARWLRLARQSVLIDQQSVLGIYLETSSFISLCDIVLATHCAVIPNSIPQFLAGASLMTTHVHT